MTHLYATLDPNTLPQTPKKPTTNTANQREHYAATVVSDDDDGGGDVFESFRLTPKSKTPNGKAGFSPTQTLPSILNTPPSLERRKFSAYVIYSGKKIGVCRTWLVCSTNGFGLTINNLNSGIKHRPI